MGNIDDIKKNLKIDNLDKNTRNQMFNKFVEKGGKVILDKNKKVINFDRDKQKIIKNNDLNQKQKILQKEEEKKQGQYKYYQQLQKNKNQKNYSFIMLLKGIYLRVFSFNSRFNKKFQEGISDGLVKIVSEIYQVTGQIVNLDESKKWNSIDILNVINTAGYEITVRFYNLFKKEGISRITDYFNESRNIICTQIIEDLKILFKELVILYPFWESSKQILWECQQIYFDITKISPILPKSKINKNIDRLFSYYLPRILIILNYNLFAKIPFEYKDIYNFAKITPDIDIGSITKEITDQRNAYLKLMQKEKEEQMKKIKDEIEKRDEEKIPKFIQKGLSIIESVLKDIPVKVQKDSNLQVFEPNEKMLELYFLINEFDKNYSFILTTSQIKFTPKLEDGVKYNIKSELENQYIKFNEIINYEKEYIKLNEQYIKLKEMYLTSPYVLHQQTVNLNSKRVHTFFEIKGLTINFLKKLTITLQFLIKDYNSEKRILQNGDDKLHLEITKDKRQKFDSFPIINAIMIIFSYTGAFHYYLTNGKLNRGGGLYYEENLPPDNSDTNNIGIKIDNNNEEPGKEETDTKGS